MLITAVSTGHEDGTPSNPPACELRPSDFDRVGIALRPAIASSAQYSQGAVSTSSSSSSQPQSTDVSTVQDPVVGLGWDKKENTADLSTYIANGLEWWCNWGMEPNFQDVGIEFVPQVWGPEDVPKVNGFRTKWPASTKHVISFNERES